MSLPRTGRHYEIYPRHERRLLVTPTTKPDPRVDALVRAHIRLVPSIVNRYRDYPVDCDELIASGNLGLVIAARKFDEARGVRFSTYATYFILREVLVAVIRELNPWHNATSGGWKSNRFFKIRAIMRQQPRERWATCVAGALDMPVATAERLLRDFTVVFTAPWDIDRQADECAADPEDQAGASEMATWITRAMRALTAQEARVIAWRYLDKRELTFEQIGASLGVSRQRAEQVERRALRVLRDAAKKEGIDWP
jgi:RNA polymerase sigma factor (sigma-70 family)